jgi:hypothetical protein
MAERNLMKKGVDEGLMETREVAIFKFHEDIRVY